MQKTISILIISLFYNLAGSQTLQTVTTSGNTTTNAIRLTGETNIGNTGGAEVVLGVLTTPKINDTRNFIGWKNSGNTITNGLAGTLLLQGRSDIANVPIDFATGLGTPVLRMRIAGNGQVLIGTNNTSPGARLFVSGESITGATTSFMVTNSATIPALRVLDNNYVGVGNGISAAFPQSKLGVFSLASDALGSDITLEKWIPTGLIGGVRFASGYLNSASSNTPYWSGIEAYGTGGVDQMDLRFYTSVGPSQQNKERMRIDQFGRIGIGTTTPNTNAILDINGVTYSRKIYVGTPDASTFGNMGANNVLAVNGIAVFVKAKVAIYGPTTWPDYVFEPSYKMTTLDSLEQFIQLNKHLPEMPTAADVEKDGLDLGDNQALLLKKIEELTLIVIEQNKRIEELERASNLNKEK